MEPWGTPNSTFRPVEGQPCAQVVTPAMIHEHQAARFCIKTEWLVLLKALLKAKVVAHKEKSVHLKKKVNFFYGVKKGDTFDTKINYFCKRS